MAVGIAKSAPLTNMETRPVVLSMAAVAQGNVKAGVGLIETVVATMDATSILKYIRVPSNGVPLSLTLSCDAAITSGAMDIGLYYAQPSRKGGAVSTGTSVGTIVEADKDCFATAQAIGSVLTLSNVLNEVAATNIDKLGKQFWEWAGLTSDPQCELDICGTITTVPGGAGTTVLVCTYIDNR